MEAGESQGGLATRQGKARKRLNCGAAALEEGQAFEGHLAVGSVELMAHIWSLGMSFQSCNPGRRQDVLGPPLGQ